jgi:prophage regulatory protein
MNTVTAHAADNSRIRLLPLPEVQAILGNMSRARVYDRVGRGLLPRPVKVGKPICFPDHEIDLIVAAHIRGATDAELAELVREIHARRPRSPVTEPLAA